MTGSSHADKALLEIACFDAESAITAWKAGADRIELCHGKDEGGTTPSLASIELVKQHVTIPVFVMIRPRGGDFTYSGEEFEQMKADIDRFKALVDGLVFGILDTDGEIDVARNSELVRRAVPLPCTFHRAFDEAKDLGRALESIVLAGCHAILSSGGEIDAEAGSVVLAGLVKQAGRRIQIVPGGGVRAKHVRWLRETTRARMFHSSGIPAGESEVDAGEIGRMKALLC